MNMSRYFLSVVTTFVFIISFNFLYHGMMLADMYGQFSGIWRPDGDIESLFTFNILVQLFLAGVISWIFTTNYEGKGIQEGVRFGFYVGILIGVIHLGLYVYLPISLTLGLAWFVGSVILGVGSGIVLSMTYRHK